MIDRKITVTFLLFFTSGLFGFETSPPELICSSAIMYDFQSGAVLYEKNSYAEIPPASMTKLMTMHLVMKEIKAGKLSLDQIVPISVNASFQASPPQSSLMFIEEGQHVTLREIMLGLAVSSGNDAAVAAAEIVAGSAEEFIKLMNIEAKELGLEKTVFFDTSGYDERSMTTASEFAKFSMFYIEQYPESLDMFHAVKEFSYPKSGNIPIGRKSSIGLIAQENNNLLLEKLEGVDGLKTGFIEESGYNISITAEREGRRLVAVIMGVPKEDGIVNRSADATSLLSYGFSRFVTYYPPQPLIPTVKVYKGSVTQAEVIVSQVPAVTLPREGLGKTYWDISWKNEPLVAPFPSGQSVGTAILLDENNNILFTRDIVTTDIVSLGSFPHKVFDSIKLFFINLFR